MGLRKWCSGQVAVEMVNGGCSLCLWAVLCIKLESLLPYTPKLIIHSSALLQPPRTLPCSFLFCSVKLLLPGCCLVLCFHQLLGFSSLDNTVQQLPHLLSYYFDTTLMQNGSFKEQKACVSPSDDEHALRPPVHDLASDIGTQDPD